jgi:phage terminase large subunit
MQHAAIVSEIKLPEIEFPEKLLFLIAEAARLKILYGGRGAGKTENIARALIILCLQKRLRIACFREIQQSIEESVHATIKNQITDMGVDAHFWITDKSIVCTLTGSEFIFSGLRYNINKIKSMARIDIAWVEEADAVSKTSWQKLGPTIRGRHETDPNGMGGPFGLGPEIWVSFNPVLDTDETYKRFVLKREEYAPDYITNEKTGEKERYAFVVELNYTDNKWFPPDLAREEQLARAADLDEWLHVWGGKTKTVLEGAIYAKEIRKVLATGRRGSVRYNPAKPVFTFWDLGHGDKTAIWFVQHAGMEYNLINYYENRLEKIGHYLEYMQTLKYVYGTCYMPHDAANETLASKSIEKLTRAQGFKVIIVPRVSSKTNGINAAKTVFDLCNFDEENTADGWQCLIRYRYKVDEDGKYSKEPLHDDFSNGADAFQTFALHLRLEPDTIKKPIATVTSRKVVTLNRSNGWMGG